MACAAALSLAFVSLPSEAETVLTIGDSLTAEYEFIENPIQVPEFDEQPLAYAEVTKTTEPAWVSRSWVEVLGLTRGFFFDFGRWRKSWGLPRFGGFERNWAIPGAKASQYEDFMTKPVDSNPLLYGFRLQLESQIRTGADRVVIWLGTNDLNAKYGDIYNATATTVPTRTEVVAAFKAALIGDLQRIVERVQKVKPKAQIVIGNLPDIAATPEIATTYESFETRKLVSVEIEKINTDIAKLAEDKDIVLADVHRITKDLLADKPFYYGAILFTPGVDFVPEVNGATTTIKAEPIAPNPDNDPHYLFTRDGFHPNTALQIQIARTFIKAFNEGYNAHIPSITHAEALKLLNISPRSLYHNWINATSVTESQRGLLKDPDGDGMTNLFEYAFDQNPQDPVIKQPFVTIARPEKGVPGPTSVTYWPIAGDHRDLNIAVQYKFQSKWFRILAERVVDNEDGSFTATVPPGIQSPPIRIKVTLVPPQGSLNTLSTVFRPPETATSIAENQ